jgi:hypothetical protein
MSPVEAENVSHPLGDKDDSRVRLGGAGSARRRLTIGGTVAVACRRTTEQDASAAAADTDYRIMGQCEPRATVPANDNTIADSSLAIRWIYEI